MKNPTLFTTFLLLASTLLCPGLSWGEVVIPIGHLRISQERLSKNGVLVSRPAPTDEKIAAIIRQNQMQSIEDYSAWLQKNITYTTHRSHDRWSEPEELLQNRQGDCKDFATFNSRVLQILGYQPRIMALTSPNSGHAICTFEYAGKIYWLDNSELKSSKASTFDELAKELTEELHYSQSFEIDITTKQTNLIYERS